jgi:excisionase family DNA binding protein
MEATMRRKKLLKPEQSLLKAKPSLLTADEMAPRLRVSKATLLRWAKSGRVPSLRPGKIFLFDPERVFDSLEQTASV